MSPDHRALPAHTMADTGAAPCEPLFAPAPAPAPRSGPGNRLHLLSLYSCPAAEAAMVARALLDQGEELERLDVSGLTPLGFAIACKKHELALVFLRLGARAEPDSDAFSPLFLAMEHGFESLALELARRGADLPRALAFWGSVIPPQAAGPMAAIERWRESQALEASAERPALSRPPASL